MKWYEKKAILRFCIIYSTAFFTLFIILASLYFYQQRSNLISESIVKQKIKYNECKKIFDTDCEKYLAISKLDLNKTYLEIAIAFLISLFLIIPFSLVMAFFSLKPIKIANKMMDDFLEHIVHDINTPLNVINLNVTSLLKTANDKDLKKLNRIKSSSEQLENMQYSLITIIKDEKISVTKDTIDVNAITRDIMQKFFSKYPKQIIEIFEFDNLQIQANFFDFQRVLENLISNAIKYNKNFNPIKIVIKNNKLEVIDQGIGIKNINRIFEKYYRENNNINGTGLGLCAVKAMCNRNSISINIKSEINKGTIVTLWLNN